MDKHHNLTFAPRMLMCTNKLCRVSTWFASLSMLVILSCLLQWRTIQRICPRVFFGLVNNPLSLLHGPHFFCQYCFCNIETWNGSKTNDYHVFCTTQGSGAEARHLKKTSVLGFAKYKDLDDDAVLSMMGVVMQMELTKLPRHNCHWNKDLDFNFMRIRECMSRDLFTSTFLLRRMWVEVTNEKVNKELESIGPESPLYTAVVSGEARGMTKAELLRCRETCERINHIDKEVWDRKLSQYLMAKRRRGNQASSARQRYSVGPGGAKWEKPLKRNRPCDNPGCKRETRGACRCSVCGKSGVVMCMACFMTPKKHREAADHRRNTFRNPPRSTELKRHRAKKCIPWENLAEQPLSGENP